MRKLQIGSFALAALSFVAWLAGPVVASSIEPSYFLAGAAVFFVIGFGSLTFEYAKAVAPEWGDDNG